MKLMLGKASTVAEASGCDWTKKACNLLAFNWLHEAAQKSPMLVNGHLCISGLKHMQAGVIGMLVADRCWLTIWHGDWPYDT